MTKCFIYLLVLLGTLATLTSATEKEYGLPNLSDYGFFEGNIADLKPKADVIPYDLNSPLFSDYAHKARFIKFPAGAEIQYNTDKVLDLPVGTTIIKNFYYYKDERKPEKGRRIIETRLLVHEEAGWKNIPYVWNDDQSDAYLDVAGETKMVTWKNADGKKQSVEYTTPNVNQCKGCHLRGNDIVPIGPSARQINKSYKYADGTKNQLTKWQELGVLAKTIDINKAPKMAQWEDESAPVKDRARGYLDANCGHCHNPDGPANTSGLFLNIHEKDMAKWGVLKAPIAAGRGSGGRLYNIQPGHPEESILVYRMASTDPGVRMPEVGRQMAHTEGVELVKAWIKGME